MSESVDYAFYKVAVAERDHERVVNARLSVENHELALWFRRPASLAPADQQDMRRFADALRADPAVAREFFRGAGILDADGRLAPHYVQAVE